MAVAFYVLGGILLLGCCVVPLFQGAGFQGVLANLYQGSFLILIMIGMGKILNDLDDLGEKCDKLEVQLKAMSGIVNKKDVLSEGGWKCTCGRENASYVGTCGCGRKKDGNE